MEKTEKKTYVETAQKEFSLEKKKPTWSLSCVGENPNV